MHRLFQRRLSGEYLWDHSLRRRVAQLENARNNQDASDAGINLLYPGPITVTVTRTVEPTLANGPIYPALPPQGQNYDEPHQPPSTLRSPDTPSPSASTPVAGSGTFGTLQPATTVTGGDLNNPQAPSASGGVSRDDDLESVSGGSKKVPPGVLIGVVILAILMTFAVVVFVVRKRYVKRRQRLRKGWAAHSKPARGSAPSVASQMEPKISFASTDPPTMLVNTSRIPLANAAAASTGPSIATTSRAPVVPPPPASYGNESLYMAPKATPSPSSGPVYGPPTTTILSQPIATVVSTFITTLPDEINITIGEAVRVLAEYDDGWALCINSRGERGMIPMECLDGRYSAAAHDASDMSRGAGGNRRRVSSLQPIVGNVGRF